ncbi:biopolymer transporter ExbD [Rapidithrix thailandica]|uniref:Biopolymer transporter ExbD n=1 Tax=Rapidithrix thailandica TaxID=413964 RepID=A0AAW9S3Z9_9BACT
MSKFKKKTKTSQEIPTSALPDIIFMLLFFFMVTTVMRETDLLVEQSLPDATQLQKLEKKSLVSYLWIGKPKDISKYGEAPRIQANDVLIQPKEIPQFVLQEKDKLDEVERDKITISLKIDRETKMGIVSDVRQELREANALKVNYSSVKGQL